MKPNLKSLTQATLATAIIAGSAFALAGDGNRGSDRERRGPPPEAFEACASAAQGDVCEVQTRRGDVRTGECRIPRRHRKAETGNLNNDNPVEATPTDESVALLCVPEHRRRSRGSETELR